MKTLQERREILESQTRDSIAKLIYLWVLTDNLSMSEFYILTDEFIYDKGFDRGWSEGHEDQ